MIFRKKRRNIYDEDDIEISDLELYALTGDPPDAHPDEEFLDPEGYQEKKRFWDNMLWEHISEKRKRSEAAMKAWETRRIRYGSRGRKKEEEEEEEEEY
ncbi:MAG: hypothetical protein Q6363_004160 [Candidatus Njordarchaeota archaeon]